MADKKEFANESRQEEGADSLPATRQAGTKKARLSSYFQRAGLLTDLRMIAAVESERRGRTVRVNDLVEEVLEQYVEAQLWHTATEGTTASTAQLASALCGLRAKERKVEEEPRQSMQDSEEPEDVVPDG